MLLGMGSHFEVWDALKHAESEAQTIAAGMPESLRDFHRAWNGIGTASAVWPDAVTLQDWHGCACAARERLLAQADLCTQLIRFALEKR